MVIQMLWVCLVDFRLLFFFFLIEAYRYAVLRQQALREFGLSYFSKKRTGSISGHECRRKALVGLTTRSSSGRTDHKNRQIKQT